MAEHWLYVPLAGLLWAVAEAAALVWQRPVARCLIVGAGVAALVIFVTITARRNTEWRDNETLYTATLRENPASSRVHFNLAVTYEDLLKNLPGAKRHYEAVLDLAAARKGPGAGVPGETFSDEEIEAHLSLGKIGLKLADYESASQHFRRLLTLTPSASTQPVLESAVLGMGKCFLGAGDTQQAVKVLNSLLAKESALRPEAEQLLANTVLPGAL